MAEEGAQRVPTVEELRTLLPASGDGGVNFAQHLKAVEPLARLWAGYGWVLRLRFDDDGCPPTAVLKYVDVAGAMAAAGQKGSEMDEGTVRKLASYRVEANFYQYLSQRLNDGGSNGAGSSSSSSSSPPPWHRWASVPRFLAPCDDGSAGDSQSEASSTTPPPQLLLLLLEDIQPTHPAMGLKSTDMTWEQCLAALDWFAAFHACYWGYGSDGDPEELCPPPKELMVAARDNGRGETWQGRGVWRIGTYNYLATRLAELQRIPASSAFAELRGPLAFAVEWLLLQGDHDDDNDDEKNGRQAQSGSRLPRPGMTLVHGDAKLANMAFAPPRAQDVEDDKAWHTAAAAAADAAAPSMTQPGRWSVSTYDLQYVGLGIGVQDLVKFIATAVPVNWLRSSTEQTGMGRGEEGLLRFYHTRLESHLKDQGESCDYTFERLLEDWGLALVAWLRFMEGWVNPVSAPVRDEKAQWLTRRGLEILNRPGWKQEVLSRWERARRPGAEMLEELRL